MERTGHCGNHCVTRFILDRGYNALSFFPKHALLLGWMADFKPVVGIRVAYRRRHPACVSAWHLRRDAERVKRHKNRKVGARIGQYLEIADLEEMTKGLPRAEAYRLIAARVRHEVENLRDQTRRPFDAKELRKQWKAERRAQVQGKVMSNER